MQAPDIRTFILMQLQSRAGPTHSFEFSHLSFGSTEYVTKVLYRLTWTKESIPNSSSSSPSI
jgi:hypothetical protein